MKITMIRDIETRGVISLPPDDSLEQALAIMDDRKISFLVIVEKNRPVGVLTERDVVRLAARHEVSDQTELTQGDDLAGAHGLTKMPIYLRHMMR